MSATRVLFICQQNSARSQMAEEYLRQMGENDFEVYSAGLEPTKINPLVVEVMREDGIDISTKTTTDVFDLYKNGELFQYVITVCSPEVEKKCPMFPGVTERINWPFPDPAKATGTQEEKLTIARKIRDDIKARIAVFINELS